jgi:hypothetical protein
MSNLLKFAILFVGVLLFRTIFGLSQPFFSPDELQSYLIGLKWYCEGGWPYFGPDLIVTETGFFTRIPGPLEAWLIGLPFKVLPIPEAPFLLLNLLSTSAIAFLSLYIARRLPEMPFAFVFVWISLLPWNLHESANIVNPSFLLIGSVLFFIGFFEAVPSLSKGFVSPAFAFALMGFGIFWNFQFHFSWVLLPPFLLLALFLRFRAVPSNLPKDLLWSFLGAAPLVALILPTFIQYGFSKGIGGMGLARAFNFGNFAEFFTELAWFFSLPAFEMPRFIGLGTHARIEFFQNAYWLVLPGVFLILVGWVQPFVLLILGFLKDEKHNDAKGITAVTWFALLMAWAGFWFTSKPPLAHMYYILLPLILVYSFYIWSRLAPRRGWRIFAAVCIAANLWFEAGYLVRMMKTQSMYLDRDKVVRAINSKDYRILGERREQSLR